MQPNKFITALRESDFYIEHLYLNGSCFQFYKLLKELYPNAEPFINDKKNHIITKIDDVYYDITGVVSSDKYIPLKKNDLKTVSKWSFRKNNLIKLSECPFCEEALTYNETK